MFRSFPRELSSRRLGRALVADELSYVMKRPMIGSMPSTARPQQRYDHRLRDLVQRTGDVTVATRLGVPRSTARGWLRAAPTVVVCLDVADLTEPELRQEVLQLRRRVQKLTALLRLALALLRTSGFRLAGARLPDGRAKMRILRAVDLARDYLPLQAALRFLRVSPSQFHAWRRRQRACALDDRASCPRTSPSRLTPTEVRAIEDMVTLPEYRHVPTGTLAVLAQRLGKVWASPSTWYRLARQNGWRRPRLRVHPAKPKTGLRTTHANEMWHIDTTVIRPLDGTRAYLHAVIDNFSRRILAWRVADTCAPVNSVTVLLEASRAATASDITPVVLADAGVENVNAQGDALIETGVLRRLLAFTELRFSNSMTEAWWRSLKHQWLFLHSLDGIATVRRLVAFNVDQHNRVLPHPAFRGQTPDEMYFGTGDAVAADLTARATAARPARVEANRSASCAACPSVEAAA
jgi:putative transposase